MDGEYSINGKTFAYEVLEINTINGDSFSGPDIEEHIKECDQVFYKVVGPEGQDYYRWLAGPYEDMDDVYAAIEDELSDSDSFPV